jgi:hypothetical protein
MFDGIYLAAGKLREAKDPDSVSDDKQIPPQTLLEPGMFEIGRFHHHQHKLQKFFIGPQS